MTERNGEHIVGPCTGGHWVRRAHRARRRSVGTLYVGWTLQGRSISDYARETQNTMVEGSFRRKRTTTLPPSNPASQVHPRIDAPRCGARDTHPCSPGKFQRLCCRISISGHWGILGEFGNLHLDYLLFRFLSGRSERPFPRWLPDPADSTTLTLKSPSGCGDQDRRRGSLPPSPVVRYLA